MKVQYDNETRTEVFFFWIEIFKCVLAGNFFLLCVFFVGDFRANNLLIIKRTEVNFVFFYVLLFFLAASFRVKLSVQKTNYLNNYIGVYVQVIFEWAR